MRALGIALAVLAMSLTSGGVDYRSNPDVAASGGLDRDAGQCLVEKPTLAILELPKLVERRAAKVRPLSGAGLNYVSEDSWHPERRAAPPPAAPRR
jgi:hypothetical protein